MSTLLRQVPSFYHVLAILLLAQVFPQVAGVDSVLRCKSCLAQGGYYCSDARPSDGCVFIDEVDGIQFWGSCADFGLGGDWMRYSKRDCHYEQVNTIAVLLGFVAVATLLVFIFYVAMARQHHQHYQRSNFQRQGHCEAPLPAHYESSLHSPWDHQAAAIAAGNYLHHHRHGTLSSSDCYHHGNNDNNNSSYNYAYMMDTNGGMDTGGGGGGFDSGGGGGGFDSGGGGMDSGGGGGGTD
jgi:uncharacterized membrane protein YgcG